MKPTGVAQARLGRGEDGLGAGQRVQRIGQQGRELHPAGVEPRDAAGQRQRRHRLLLPVAAPVVGVAAAAGRFRGGEGGREEVVAGTPGLRRAAEELDRGNVRALD